MTKKGDNPLQDNEYPNSQAPLSAIELNVIDQLLKGYSIFEITANVGYSDILITSALRSIQSKTGSNNLVQATIKLVQSGVLKT